MYTFDDLSLNDRIAWISWIEKHDINAKSKVHKRSLHPTDEVALYLLKE